MQDPLQLTRRGLALGWLAATVMACATGTEPIPEITPTTSTPSTDALALRDQLRQLWTQHVAWTRVVIMDSIAELPDTGYAIQRLLRNQVEIGNSVKPFLGEKTGNDLGDLLDLHVSIAADILSAAKARDDEGVAAAKSQWIANADLMATLLANANPAWAIEDLQSSLHLHLDLTLREMLARVAGYTGRDLEAYDQVVLHARDIADAWAEGLAARFSGIVAKSPLTKSEEGLHETARALLEDQVSWERFLLIDAAANLADTQATHDRLARTQRGIAELLGSNFSAAAAEQLGKLLAEHVAMYGQVIRDARTGTERQLAWDESRWRSNAAELATLLASENANWDAADLQLKLTERVGRTVIEIKERLAEHWSGDIAAYDVVEREALAIADVLSAGLAKQVPENVQ